MKKLIAVSSLLLAFSGLASAESQITLYGIVDGGLNYYKLNHRSAVVKMENGHVQGEPVGYQRIRGSWKWLCNFFPIGTGISSF